MSSADLAAPIELALDHIKEDDQKFKVLLLVSDGEEHQGDAIKLAESALLDLKNYYLNI